MNSNLAQQHTPNKAEPRPRKDSIARRHGRTWSDGFPLSAQDDGQVARHDEPKAGARNQPREEAETRTGRLAGAGTVLMRTDSGRPALLLDGDEKADLSETVESPYGEPKIPNSRSIKTGRTPVTVAPFPKRAEAQLGVTKQVKLHREPEPTLKGNARRLSSTRPTKSPPSVIKAENLERSPWTGQRPEDRLTDLVIKNGYFEKAQVHNEANPAKPSLLPHLKTGSGIQNLSSLFAAVLQRREEQGRVTASSTFKPPPRVTLTDTKREAWIHDLANPAVPLRRLSRTIPHGIRGKLLLDQCLAKQIPMTRAVWLARCVGANELRAFRRKGISGTVMVENESRWTREWTSIVETFNQECIDARSQSGWKARVSYAMQLTSRFFSAGLLDRDHFFDWLLANLERYTWEIFPMALFSARNYWRELTSTLRHGRRLASACCSRLADLVQLPDHDLYGAIAERLQQLIRVMLVSHPSCIIIPNKWSHIRHAVNISVPEDDQMMRLAFSKVADRNARFDQQGQQKSASELTGATAIIAILDAANAPFSYESLSSLCLSKCSDFQDIVTTVVRWSASQYRTGSHNLYLAAGLIRTWIHKGLAVGDCILHALTVIRKSHGLCFRSLSQLMAELVRSKHFNPGRYFRWLVASGALNGISVEGNRPAPDIELVLGMPESGLAPNVVNLRQMILRGVGLRTSQASQYLDAVNRLIDQRFASWDFQPQQELGHSTELLLSLYRLNAAEKYTLSDTLRLRIGSLLSDLTSDLVSVVNDNNSQTSVIMNHIAMCQGILETIGDFWALDNVSQITVQIADTVLLTSMAGLVARNLDAFDAIAPSRPMWLGVHQRYRILRLTGPPLKAIASPLLQMAIRMNADKEVVQHLEAEIAMSDASLTAAAYTPISDIQLDTLQNPSVDLEESIEQLAANPTTMDARVVARMFEAILSWVQLSAKSQRSDISVIKPFVARLRSHHEKLFDVLASEWFLTRMMETEPRSLAETVTVLTDTGCITLTSIAQRIIESEGTAKIGIEMVQILSVKFLAMVLLYPHITESAEVGWSQLCREQPHSMLRCLRHAICLSPSGLGKNITSYLEAILSSQALVATIHHLLLVNPALLYRELDVATLEANQHALANLKAFVSKVVDPADRLGISNSTTDIIIHTLFETIDDLALPSYQLGLCVFCAVSVTDQSSITTSVLDAAKMAMSGDCVLCTRLISVLDKAFTKEIRVFAETALLKDYSRLAADTSEEHNTSPFEAEVLEKYLGVVEATMPSIPETGEPGLGQMILKALDFIVRQVVNREPSSSGVLRTCNRLQSRIHILLRLSLIHMRSSGSSPHDFRISFLSTLCTLLTTRSPFLTPESREFIFDVAGLFSSDLISLELATLDDTLGLVAQYPLMRFLFGFRPPQNAWLYLDSTLSSSLLVPGTQLGSAPIGPRPPTHSQHQPLQPAAPFPLRQWELLPDSTPNVGVNDTALSLRLFGARKL